MRPASLAFTALMSTLTLAAGAFSGPAPKHDVHADGRARSKDRTARVSPMGPAALRYGRSLGSPTEGHLLGGAHLVETDYLRIEPNDTAGDVRWGLEPLVSMLDRAARAVRQKFPTTITSVGHLSRDGGGDINGHRSHESGRDADVGFFVRSAGGKQLMAQHFVPFKADGTAPSWPGAYFDDARNWTLVSSMIEDPEAHVTHLFVAAPLRARLLAYAERAGAPQSARMHAAELMQQPHGVLPHDDHFHVRIGCPPHQSGCVENPTIHVARSGSSLLAQLAHGHRTLASPAAHALVTPAPRRGAGALPTVTPLTPMPPPSDTGESEPDPTEPPALLSAPIDDVDG